MTRFAKHKKEKKPIGDNATPWQELKESPPITEQEKRKEEKRAEKRAEKHRKRQLKKTCFRCRTPGHSMNECTAEIADEQKKTTREVKTGICYKCGSTEHRLNQCTVKGDSFAYATCFVCGKQGHWSRLCPDNPNGLYPNGGCCNECGSVQHFKRDCPTLLKKQGIDDQQLPRLTANTNNIDDQVDSTIENKTIIKPKKSIKRLKMKIAIEGCCHGELDRIYQTIDQIQKDQQIQIDLLLICGDFQSVRNEHDLQSMAVPPKYRSMQDFWRYYSGEKKAPILTIFIGGNHESSDFLIELPYGGWVAPNIYYMGYANVVNFNGLRIGGLSGIYKSHDYNSGHHELPPFNEKTIRSIYHIRSLDVYRIKQLKAGQVDIMISHDWPRGIVWYGDTQRLLQRKQYFHDDVYSNQLGSEPLEEVLLQIQPKYWFSAHLHVKFAALVEHANGQCTRFLALDKCLPNRDFLQILDIEPTNPLPSPTNHLSLDPEWLCILSKTDQLLHVQRTNTFLPPISQNTFRPTEEDLQKIRDDFSNTFDVPDNFIPTASIHQAGSGNTPVDIEQLRKNNPQTDLICLMLGIRNPIDVILNRQIQPIQYDQSS